MAIFHLDVKVISRSQGRSVVGAAAYRAGEKLIDERQGMVFDYSRKEGVVFSEMRAPENAPSWVKDRATLWNTIEAMEKRKDAQLAREMMVALPQELSPEERIDLIRDFCDQQFVSKGMVDDIHIHDDNPDNPHAHILLTMRELSSEGFGLKNREWNKREHVFALRRSWQDIANNHLHVAGHTTRIDCRSLKERGIDLEPGIHLGMAPHHAMQRGEGDDFVRAVEHQEILRANGERLIQDPSVAIEKLTQQQAVFDDYDMAKLANQYSADLAQYERVLAAIKGVEQIVMLGENDKGKTCYSTRNMIEQEHQLLNTAYELEAKSGHKVSCDAANQALIQADKNLNENQQKAFSHLIQAGDLKIVTGLAGTGKSTLMGVAKEAFQKVGFQVTSVCLSGIAAKGLEEGSGIFSTTVDARLHQWDKGQNLLTQRDVLVIDEAGMLGTQKMSRLLQAANEAGAKVVIVHDKEQLGAIQAGAPSRILAERFGETQLTEVVRQHSADMRRATYEFGTGQTARALARYEQLGAIHGAAADAAIARKLIIEAWASERLAGKSQLMLAFTNDSVKALNELARQVRIEAGEIESGENYKVARGERSFSAGDRVYFLKNHKMLGVQNGSLGTITSINEKNFSILLDGKGERTVNLNLFNYPHLDYGYAATIHKSQGVTVDKSYVLASQHFDRHLTYVACTRHRESLQLFYHQADFKTKADFYRTVGREQGKTMAVDFAMARWLAPNNGAELYSNARQSSVKERARNQVVLKRLQAMMGDKHVALLKGFEKVKGFVQGIVEVTGKKWLATLKGEHVLIAQPKPSGLNERHAEYQARHSHHAEKRVDKTPAPEIRLHSMEKTQHDWEISR